MINNYQSEYIAYLDPGSGEWYHIECVPEYDEAVELRQLRVDQLTNDYPPYITEGMVDSTFNTFKGLIGENNLYIRYSVHELSQQHLSENVQYYLDTKDIEQIRDIEPNSFDDWVTDVLNDFLFNDINNKTIHTFLEEWLYDNLVDQCGLVCERCEKDIL